MSDMHAPLDGFALQFEGHDQITAEDHGTEVALSIICAEGRWRVDLDEVFRLANEYGLEPFEGNLSHTGVHLIRFREQEHP